jgi:hypothetical protein
MEILAGINLLMRAALTIKNLKTKSTGVAAIAATGVVAAHEVLPADSMESAIVQVVLGLVALYGFFKQPKA